MIIKGTRALLQNSGKRLNVKERQQRVKEKEEKSAKWEQKTKKDSEFGRTVLFVLRLKSRNLPRK